MISSRSVVGGMMAATLAVVTIMAAAEALAHPRGNSAANRSHAGHGWANRNSWAHQSAGRRIGHAIDYSRDLRGYSAYPQAVQPQAQPAPLPVTAYPVIVTEEIGRNISAAKRDIGRVKKAPEVAKDAEAQKSFEAIEKHLTAAAEQHSKMEECCASGEVDSEMLMTCCDEAIKHLEAAKAENEKLMKRLYPGDTNREVKPDAKK